MNVSFRGAWPALLLLAVATGVSRGAEVPAAATRAEPIPVQTLTANLHHLRWGTAREWESFPETPESADLSLTFASTANTAERTLRVRHADLRQAWELTLNDRKLAMLPAETGSETVTYWPVPAGALRDGQNTLRVWCPAKPPGPGASPTAPVSDDVLIGDVALIDAPRKAVVSQATVSVAAFDAGSDAGLPCRITVTDSRGALVDLGNAGSDDHAVRPGVVYSKTGRADLLLPAGKYTIHAGRGFEYDLPSVTLDVRPGDKTKQEFRLRRVVPTEGWVACDPHVHTFTFSRHGDATIAERMITLAGEGIELPIATDHNLNVDFEKPAIETGTRRFFTPITGKLPDWRAPTWAKLAESIDSIDSIDAAKAGDPAIIILNHARDLHLGFRPFDPIRHVDVAGENLDGWDLPANAMEVVNSSATLTDAMLLYRDWFGLMNRGKWITPIGASDSHDVNRYVVGQARTYVRAKDADAGKIDVVDAVRAIREGRVLVSYGLIADLTVNGKYGPGDLVLTGKDSTEKKVLDPQTPVSGRTREDPDSASKPNPNAASESGSSRSTDQTRRGSAKDSELKVAVRVLGPEWTRATNVTLYANGVPIRSAEIAPAAGKPEPAGVKFETTWTLPKPRHDVWLTVVATGPGIDAGYWPMTKPYQKTSPAWKSYCLGSSGAVRIDADGSGTFESAYQHAERIVTRTDGDVGRALAELREYEPAAGDASGVEPAIAESVGVQIASLLRRTFPDDFETPIKAQIDAAGPAGRRGVEQYLAAWKKSAEARKPIDP